MRRYPSYMDRLDYYRLLLPPPSSYKLNMTGINVQGYTQRMQLQRRYKTYRI